MTEYFSKEDVVDLTSANFEISGWIFLYKQSIIIGSLLSNLTTIGEICFSYKILMRNKILSYVIKLFYINY